MTPPPVAAPRVLFKFTAAIPPTVAVKPKFPAPRFVIVPNDAPPAAFITAIVAWALELVAVAGVLVVLGVTTNIALD